MGYKNVEGRNKREVVDNLIRSSRMEFAGKLYEQTTIMHRLVNDGILWTVYETKIDGKVMPLQIYCHMFNYDVVHGSFMVLTMGEHDRLPLNNCPLSFLELADTVVDPRWRKSVKEFHRKQIAPVRRSDSHATYINIYN